MVTNPAFSEMTAAIVEMTRKETECLTQHAQESDLARINHQAGIVEGIKRVLVRLDNYRADSLADFRADGKPRQPPELVR
jgi:hypothetical protein